MRIVAGTARSRTIQAPPGQDTRPTLDRVRETVFNLLQGRVADTRVLDLYAGSGALALEAVSRGAREAVLVDVSRDALRCIRANVAALGFDSQCRVMAMTDRQAVAALAGQAFDLIFLDPPYRMDTTDTVHLLLEKGLIAPETLVVVEYDCHVPRLEEAFTCIKERRFGDTHVRIYRLAREEETP